MPDRAAYETGVRAPVEKSEPDASEDFSQDAATNKPPPSPFGNSEPVDDLDERTRQADGHKPSGTASPRSFPGQAANAGHETVEPRPVADCRQPSPDGERLPRLSDGRPSDPNRS